MRACPLTAYQWRHVAAYVAVSRRLQALACCARAAAAALESDGVWGGDRAFALSVLAYRSPVVEGVFLNGLRRAGFEAVPFVVRVDAAAAPGGAWGVGDGGDAALLRPARSGGPRRRARWRRFYGETTRAGVPPARTECVGVVEGRRRRGVPPGLAFCEVREKGPTGAFWNPAQSNPYGREVCPCEYRGAVLGFALVGLAGFTDHPLCGRRRVGSFALALPPAAPRAALPGSWARLFGVGAGVMSDGMRGPACATVGTYALRDGKLVVDRCDPPRLRVDAAGDADVGRWAAVSLVLRRGTGGEGRATWPLRAALAVAASSVRLDGALSADGSFALRGPVPRDRRGPADDLDASDADAAPPSPYADAFHALGGARFPYDFSAGAKVEVHGSLLAGDLHAVFRVDAGHPSFHTYDGALALRLAAGDGAPGVPD